MTEHNWDIVDVLKIDIEGAERFVFESLETIMFLKFVKILIIEIHDEFNIRYFIYDQLRDNGFLIYNFGETTLAVNLKYISKEVW